MQSSGEQSQRIAALVEHANATSAEKLEKVVSAPKKPVTKAKRHTVSRSGFKFVRFYRSSVLATKNPLHFSTAGFFEGCSFLQYADKNYFLAGSAAAGLASAAFASLAVGLASFAAGLAATPL